jgi:hypothetical protein
VTEQELIEEIEALLAEPAQVGLSSSKPEVAF